MLSKDEIHRQINELLARLSRLPQPELRQMFVRFAREHVELRALLRDALERLGAVDLELATMLACGSAPDGASSTPTGGEDDFPPGPPPRLPVVRTSSSTREDKCSRRGSRPRAPEVPDPLEEAILTSDDSDVQPATFAGLSPTGPSSSRERTQPRDPAPCPEPTPASKNRVPRRWNTFWPNDPALDREIDRFLETVSPRTRGTYRSVLADFFSTLDISTLEELLAVTGEQVVSYWGKLLAKDLSTTTIRTRLATVRSLFALFLGAGRIRENPVKVVRGSEDDEPGARPAGASRPAPRAHGPGSSPPLTASARLPGTNAVALDPEPILLGKKNPNPGPGEGPSSTAATSGGASPRAPAGPRPGSRFELEVLAICKRAGRPVTVQEIESHLAESRYPKKWLPASVRVALLRLPSVEELPDGRFAICAAEE